MTLALEVKGSLTGWGISGAWVSSLWAWMKKKKPSWFRAVAWSTLKINFLSWLSLAYRFHSSHSCCYSWKDTATLNFDVYLLLIVWLHWNYHLYDSLYLLHLDTTVASERCCPLTNNLSCSGFQVYSLKGFFCLFGEVVCVCFETQMGCLYLISKGY